MGIGLYGGTINSGTVNGKELTAGSCYEAIGEFQAGSINEEDLYGRLSSLMLRTLPLSPLCHTLGTAWSVAASLELVHVEACLLPTPCRRRLKRWACLCQAPPPSLPSTEPQASLLTQRLARLTPVYFVLVDPHVFAPPPPRSKTVWTRLVPSWPCSTPSCVHVTL